MSKHALIFCTALGLATTLWAQTPGQPAKAGAPVRVYANPSRLSVEVANKEPYRDVTLEPGTLREVVEQLDEVYSDVQRKNGPAEYAMPNLVWSPETMELPVPAALRIFEVNAVDALTLIGAAAGCKLEPIESPQADAKERRIIGYKFVRAEARMGRMSAAGGGGGFDPLAGGGGVGSVRAVGSGNPNAPSPTGVPAKAVPGLPGNTTVTTVTSTTGATAKGNLRELQEELARMQQTLGEQHPRMVEMKRRIEAVEKVSVEQMVTRVYAMGGIITGNDKEQAVKLAHIQDSISKTLSDDEIDEKGVRVSYHDRTNVLVVRAPEAAQELVGQLIEALRENVKTVNSKP